ncbi:MAG TPA: DUF6484 domain-containing protein [Caldimonas sp.]|jgi:hypothetical protein|nr:DUF6484 domain-containing protein [Caldimonas sp.]
MGHRSVVDEAVRADASPAEKQENAPTLLDHLLSRPNGGGHERVDGVVVGELVALLDDCSPMVIFPDRPELAAVPARTLVPLGPAHVGREIVLMFERGDPRAPIVMGIVQKPETLSANADVEAVLLEIDGRRTTVSARDALVLRCGKSRITLSSSGKVLIEGTYVVSRSSGANKVMGGSVHLN